LKILTSPLPEIQKSLLWRVTEAKRLTYQKQGELLMKKALNLSILPFASHYRTSGIVNIDLVDETPIQVAFRQLYGRVGSVFAAETYGAIKKDYTPLYQIKRRRRRRFVGAPSDLESTWLQYMQRFAITKAGERIKGIVETTKKFIQSTLEKASIEGLSIQNTAKLLTSEWKELTNYRAKVIARTEIISASNGGSFIGAQSTGLNLEKEWLATKDSRTRDTHRHLDGQKRAMGDDFSNGLAYPGDPSGSASETVMCRCTIVYNVLE
jgi:hypothetical protein